MAYIGRDIDNGLLTKQTFTGVNGSTTVFTLDQSVGDATSLIVSVGGVIQEPNVGFTAVGDTLTFTGAPANGATVWAIYIGKEVLGEGASNTGTVAYQTGTGDTTTTPITLSQSVGGTSEILVALNGVAQVPDTEYTVSGTTLTFASGPANGVGILVYYFGAAGILNVVADGAVTAAGFAASGTLPAWNGNALTNLDSADLIGALPAISASNLTGLVEGLDTTSANDPTITTNPGTGVGTMWLNSSSGELYCCTDATTNDNIWTNIGDGAGHIIAPTNANDTFPDLAESATTNFTFAGGTDDGTVTHYFVDQISNTSLLGVTASEVAAGSAHSFVTQAVGSDTSVTFRVRTKDNLGLYSPGITITTIIENDEPPTNPTNGGAFADIVESSSQNYTFAGATDDNGVTHYMVDQISNAALTVSAAEVTAGNAHTFNTGAVGSDTAVTFRVRAKDTIGQYSSGVTVSMNVTNLNHISVTASVSPTVDGDYHVYTFGSTGTFNVTAIPASGPNTGVRYLVVSGGGSGATLYGAGAPGGGAGGMRFNNTEDHTVSVQNYNITVGGGGPVSTDTSQWAAQTGYKGGDSTFDTITSAGGGGGSRNPGGGGQITAQSYGGSGGGGSWGGGPPGLGNQPATSPSQGNNGGVGTSSGGGGAGGGGHSQTGFAVSGVQGGDGGDGTANSITGSSVYYAGGGGGGSNNSTATGGTGGLGGGGNGHNPNTSTYGEDGTDGLGGGGGGSGYPRISWPSSTSEVGKGGDGVVIIRVKFKN